MKLRSTISSAYNSHNKVRLVRGGRDYFDTLIQLIDETTTSINFQTYIFDDDETGKNVKDALIRAAKRNVKIFLLLDGYASKNLPENFIKELTSEGIFFRWFEPLFGSKKFYFGRRLHHKVIVFDQKCALVGGINISNRYNDIEGTAAWLDFAVFVEGQSAKSLHLACLKLWGRKKQTKVPHKKNNQNPSHLQSTIPASVRVRRNDWVRGKNDISRSYIEMFNHAKQYITIVSSYFLPSRVLRLRIRAAAKRGVKVKVVLAGVSDVQLSRYAARYLYAWLLKNKIEIYEYKKTVLHAKVATCDDEWATVGSYNVNNLSAYASIELNLDIKNKEFTENLNNVIAEIISNDCEKITEEKYNKQKNIWGFIASWGSYTIARMFLFLFTYSLKQEKRKPVK